MAAPLLPLTGTLLPRGSFGKGLHEPGAAHTLEDHTVTICNILCAHLGGKYFLSYNFKTINMIVDIQQNQQLQQQIAKLANNLGQLNKGNKQANNEKKQTKETNKQQTNKQTSKQANKQTNKQTNKTNKKTKKQQLQKTLTGISIGDQRPFLHLIRPLPTSWKFPDFSIF